MVLETKEFEKKKKKLMPSYVLTNIEMQKYYQNKPIFNGSYSGDNLAKIKDGAYVINFDEHYDIGTHRIALYVQNNDVIYFDSFGVEYISKEIKTFINKKNIKRNIFIIQAYDSMMCGYFCIQFIDLMLAGMALTDFKNLFSPNNLEENDEIVLNYFMANV